MPISQLSPDEIQTYDFRRPPWISRERRAVLDGVHDKAKPALERLFTGALRRPASVTIGETIEVSFGDWRRGVTTPVMAFVLPLATDEGGTGLVRLFPTLAHALVDTLLGGNGDAGERPMALTPFEQEVLADFISEFAAISSGCYREVAPFTPGTPRYEPIVESLNMVDLHERVLLLEFLVTAGEISGVITLMLPASRVERFARGATGKAVTAPPPSPAAMRMALEHHLRGARVPVVVRLTGYRLTARDGASLKPGQVLASNHPFEGTVEMYVNGHARFLGALGSNQGRVGLRILESIDAPSIIPRLLRKTTP